MVCEGVMWAGGGVVWWWQVCFEVGGRDGQIMGVTW